MPTKECDCHALIEPQIEDSTVQQIVKNTFLISSGCASQRMHNLLLSYDHLLSLGNFLT